eukprot:GHVN01082183.1.p1 GENE.GHVN01082183.1~~GHVN01082183.1.p1  ORF type:complete len:109 (-),score=19.99 GHVN01082183.1:1031-1357(-)
MFEKELGTSVVGEDEWDGEMELALWQGGWGALKQLGLGMFVEVEHELGVVDGATAVAWAGSGWGSAHHPASHPDVIGQTMDGVRDGFGMAVAVGQNRGWSETTAVANP